MRFSPRAILVLALLVPAARAAAEDPFLLELEPEDKGHRGTLDLHAFLTAPRRIQGVDLSLSCDTGLVGQVSVRVPDEYKSPDLAAQARITDAGIDAAVTFSAAGPAAPPAGARVKAFTIHICLAAPSPPPGWDFPVEVLGVAFRLAGEDAPVSGDGTVPPIRIDFGTSDSPPCRDEPPPPEFFGCETQPGGGVLLTWRNPVEYSQIRIKLAQNREVILPGDATSWLHDDGASTNFVYSIKGFVARGEARRGSSEYVSCAAEDPRPAVNFIRGDANSDGLVSTADILAIQRWLFSGEDPPQCIDSADVDDDGQISNIDQAALVFYLFGMEFAANNERFDGGDHPPAPFPEPGPDPTHAGEAPHLSCEAYEVMPAAVTEDAIRLGDVEAAPGGEAFIPVHLTNAVPVEAVQLVVRYDPSVLAIASGRETLSYEGTYYEQFMDRRFTVGSSMFVFRGPYITQVDVHEDDGVFTASIVSNLFFAQLFAIEPGEETLIARIRVEVSPDVPPGTRIPVAPENGPGGAGYGPFRLHNELTYQGDGRYATVLPRQIGGVLQIGVDGDISFFVRGDANDDEQVDLADAVAVLGHLFLGEAGPRCEDAADSDDDGAVLVTDAIVILNHLFAGSGPLPPPYPEAGRDTRPDFLDACRER